MEELKQEIEKEQNNVLIIISALAISLMILMGSVVLFSFVLAFCWNHLATVFDIPTIEATHGLAIVGIFTIFGLVTQWSSSWYKINTTEKRKGDMILRPESVIIMKRPDTTESPFVTLPKRQEKCDGPGSN